MNSEPQCDGHSLLHNRFQFWRDKHMGLFCHIYTLSFYLSLSLIRSHFKIASQCFNDPNLRFYCILSKLLVRDISGSKKSNWTNDLNQFKLKKTNFYSSDKKSNRTNWKSMYFYSILIFSFQESMKTKSNQ
jgi:hypothetical protein